ncbi:MAG: fold [Actinomycetota bacterium]|jgi:PAS domain S-box-containing protein
MAESLLTFENAALPLSVVCPKGRIVMVNRAMRELLRYEFSALVGRSMHEVVLSDHDELNRIWDDRLQGGQRVSNERRWRLLRGDGTELTVSGSSVLVRDGQGAVRYLVARVVPVPD